MNANDFQIVKVIGRGAFGEVQLVSITRLALLTLWAVNNTLESESSH